MIEELLRQTGTRPASFSFRGVQPIHAGETVHVEGRESDTGWDLWLRDDTGTLRMSAQAARP